jgi:hypothetical protein
MILLMAYIPTAGIKTGGNDYAEKVGLMYLKSAIEQPQSMRHIKHLTNVKC